MGSWKVDVLLHKILGTHYQRWIPYPKGNFPDAFLDNCPGALGMF